MKNKRAISSATFINSRLTATISISLVLFLLGLIILLSLFVKNLSSYVKENLSFDIVLSDTISEKDVIRLINNLEATDYIKSAEFISKDIAVKQLEEDIGQNPKEILGFNPLPDIIVVRLHSEYVTPEKFSTIEHKIKQLSPDFINVEYRKELVTMVNDNFQKISIVLLSIAVLLLIISFALINNTIRLAIYANRFLIHAMQLVGASEGFIRKPFVIAQIVAGMIAAIFAIALLYWGFYYVSKDINEIKELIDRSDLTIVAVSVFILGIIITLSTTYFAVNRYLRMEEDNMYFV